MSSARAQQLVAAHRVSSAPFDGDDARALDDVALRTEILEHLHPAPMPADAPILREILKREVAARAAPAADGDAFENLYWCAFLLSRIGDLADVMPLWHAKHTDFDTTIGFDLQFVLGAGVDETLRYLDTLDDAQGREASAFIREWLASEDPGELAEWVEWRTRYFSSLEE